MGYGPGLGILAIRQSAPYVHQTGFGKRAAEVIEWAEKCEHAENTKTVL